MNVPVEQPQSVANRFRADRLWAVAYASVVLMPWMIMFARAGMEICGALIGLTFLAHSYRVRDWRWLRDPLMLLMLVSWAWLLLVVTPLAVKPQESLPDALAWIRFPLMVMALSHWVLKRREDLYVFMLSIAAMMVFVSVDTLWQSATGVSLTGHPKIFTGRLTGPFETPKVGVFINRFLVVCLAVLAMHLPTRGQRRGIAALVGLGFMVLLVILLSGERSALLTTLLAGGIASLAVVWKWRSLRIYLAIAALAVVGMLVGAYHQSTWIRERADQGFETMQHYLNSDYGLLAVAAYDVGRSHVLHGVGLKGFRDFCPDLHYHGFIFTGLHPHNIYMEWFAETGLPGLLLLVAFVSMLLYRAWVAYRAAHGNEVLVTAAVLGLTVQLYFPLMGMQSNFTNWPAMLYWFPVAFAFAALPRRAER